MARVRSGYSFRAAVGKLEEVASQLDHCGYPSFPLTDTASTFGFVRWAKLAEKYGRKPVFGVELAVTESINAKRPVVDHWCFIAKDNLEELNLLFELATTQFRYQPLLTYEQAQKNNLFKIVGHRSNLDLISPHADLFVGLSPSVSKGYLNRILIKNFQPIMCSDNRYPRQDDKKLYEIICGRNASNQTYPQYIQNATEWENSVLGSKEFQSKAMMNMGFVLAASNAQLKKSELLSPAKTKTLRQLCEEGASRIGCNITDPIYAARLERELKLIEEKKFEDYFFIIADLCQWARKMMIVGPARGSSCGSLVCYLLEITTVDPIPYGLIFERFIDIQRADLPDIDIDFSDQQRHLVFEYLENKYGAEFMARLGTVAMYKSDSVLNEAGKALQVPKWKVDAVSESLLKRSSGDARALDTIEDTFKTFETGKELIKEFPEMIIATRMEGHPRHSSQHASGFILTKEPVHKYVAIDRRTNSTQCDKKDAEVLNLLKIDILGLKQLSVLENALELAKLDRFHLNTISMEDPEAFKILNDGKFAGIFQFNGMALQSIVKQFELTQLNDIISVTALARPGPLASGGAHEWVRRKNGIHVVSYPHPMFEPYLKDTLGIVLYQEQVMEIGRNVGDLSWEDVSSLRKAMSKSLGKEYFDQYGDKWKTAAIKKGCDSKTMVKVWDDLCAYGSWCLSGETILKNPHPNQYFSRKYFTLKELYEGGGRLSKKNWFDRRQKLFSWDGKGLKPFENINVMYSGKQKTFEVQTEHNFSIRTTKMHKFLMPDGSYKRLKDLKVFDYVMVETNKTIPSKRKLKTNTGSGRHNWRSIELIKGEFLNGKRGNRSKILKKYKICQRCKKNKIEEIHHKNGNHKDHRLKNLMGVCRKCHKKFHQEMGLIPFPYQKGKLIKPSRIIFIGKSKMEETYDIQMPNPNNNFLANGFIVHNSFNKSHAVAYGIISYWCCWLKAHYPFEFAAATLNFEDDPIKQLKLLREIAAEGFEYLPVDKDISTDKWLVGNKAGKKMLIGPVTNIKGVGPKMVAAILSARARGEELPDRCRKLLENPKTPIDSLFPIADAFKRELPNPSERNIFTPPTKIKDIEIKANDYDVLVFCILTKINPRDENEEINVARRGGKRMEGNLTASLNLQLTDDSDTVFGKINRFNYPALGKEVVDRGRPGKCLYAVKGTVKGGTGSFRMISIKNIRYIGDI